MIRRVFGLRIRLASDRGRLVILSARVVDRRAWFRAVASSDRMDLVRAPLEWCRDARTLDPFDRASVPVSDLLADEFAR